MWNNSRKQEALEGGVFTRKAFIDVGADGEPCPYRSPTADKDDRLKGKQFAIAATKTGVLPKDMLDTQFKPLFQGVGYVDKLPYQTQEKPSKGFLTSDFCKRDEFSLSIRMEQHRDIIKHEARVQKAAEAKRAGAAAVPAADQGGSGGAAQPAQPPKDAPLLYDLVFEGEPELCIKAKRDTRNPTACTERHNGPMSTTSHSAHVAPPKVTPPLYGIKRNEFT